MTTIRILPILSTMVRRWLDERQIDQLLALACEVGLKGFQEPSRPGALRRLSAATLARLLACNPSPRSRLMLEEERARRASIRDKRLATLYALPGVALGAVLGAFVKPS